jgi:hypothetical protein
MMNKMVAGATRVNVGKQQGYLGLCILDRPAHTPDGALCNEMVTLWEPTEREVSALNGGALIQIGILGDGWPPLHIQVVELPEHQDQSAEVVAYKKVLESLQAYLDALSVTATSQGYVDLRAEAIEEITFKLAPIRPRDMLNRKVGL